jgi:hypothetical protein
MAKFPLSKGGGAERQRSRSARGLSVPLSEARKDNPLMASRPREIFSRFHLRLPSPFVKGEFSQLFCESVYIAGAAPTA